MNAEVVGEGIINWYNQDRSLIQANASSINVFVNPGETTYFVEQEIIAPKSIVGPYSDEFGSGSFHDNGSTQYLIFNTAEEVTIDSVWVNSSINRSRTIQLWDSAGQLIDSRTVSIPAGRQQIALNLKVPAGVGYRIGGTRMGLFRNNIGPMYPYTSENGILTITNSSAGPSYYYYLYNWTIRGASCKSRRVPIKVRRSAGPRPVSNFDFRVNGRTISFNDLSTNAESWLWNFGNGDTSINQHPVYEYQEEGEYLVSLQVFDSEGICTDVIEQTVKAGGTTNIDEELGGAIVKLYPNPGKGVFEVYFEHTQPSEVQITVYNFIGAKVYQSAVEQNQQRMQKQINLADMASGTYIVQVRIDGHIAFRKYLLK